MGGDVIVGLGLTVGLGPCPLLCLFYFFYFLFLFFSSLWHMCKASPCSPRRPPRRRLALQTGSLAVPRLNALRTMVSTILSRTAMVGSPLLAKLGWSPSGLPVQSRFKKSNGFLSPLLLENISLPKWARS